LVALQITHIRDSQAHKYVNVVVSKNIQNTLELMQTFPF